jgi:hypothetical protein
MADLTVLEKRKLEDFLEMHSGYVLKFVNRSFAEFVTDSTGRNIFDARYDNAGGSKANRLRQFWTIEDNAVVGKLLNDLIDCACYDGKKGELAEDCRGIAGRLLKGNPQAHAQRPAEQAVAQQPRGAIDSKEYEKLSALLREVMQVDPNPRGFAFERFLDELFAAFDLAPRRSFRLVGEQIDGSFHHASETYLVEAKWQDPQIGNRELQAFAGSVRTKATWARGLYVSYSGFSGDGLEAFARGDATRIICLDGLELWNIIEKQLDLSAVLSMKTRRAAETGRAFVPIRELFPTV